MSGETQDRPKGHALGRGAADGAPTSPHATPHASAPEKRSGPERFWDRKRVRRALVATLLLSTFVHYLVAPWSLFPEKKLELREVDGELTINIETFEQEQAPPAPPEPPPPPPVPETPTPEGQTESKRDAGPPKPRDAGRDAAPKPPRDASGDVELDAPQGDGSVIAFEPGDAGSDLDGAIAMSDAAVGPPGAGGPRDPSGFIGAAGAIQPGVPNVQVFVNVVEVRKTAVAGDISRFFALIPDWDTFIAGTNVDPIRDTEWVYMFGPSLYTKRTSKLAIFIRYSASDAVVDKAVETVSKKYASGGPFDAGVPGVKAYLGHADFAPRVFLRPQSHLLVVVPPENANAFARVLVKGGVNKKGRPGEIVRVTVKDPGRPMPFLPQTIKELRIWATPREDGGLDLYGEGDTPDDAAATAATADVKKLVASYARNPLVTFGLPSAGDALEHADITSSGNLVRLHVPITAKQLKDIVTFAAGYTGVAK